MFPRMVKDRIDDTVLFKTYVSSTKTFEFGPLLAGQEPEMYADTYNTLLSFVAVNVKLYQNCVGN